MQWRHKDLLDISQLTKEEIFYIFEVAKRFQEINQRPVKKLPTLKGKSVVLFFAEPSTRTKTSFDIAAKRLSADTFSLTKKGSSIEKGESLKDTALTLQAMNPDLIAIRHKDSGAPYFLSKLLKCSIINAGDGQHSHPTQALLDGFTLLDHWKDFEGKILLILGDIKHSRVARSDIELFTKLGTKVRVCAPRTLLPKTINSWPVEVYTDLNEACKGVDAIQCLRLQLERQTSGLLPSLREYSKRFGLKLRHLDLANPDVKIMHPGPMNRGVEISDEVADCKDALILDQVNSGVCIRMALLYIYLIPSTQR